MKILHVISALTKGGGERIMVEMANEALKQGNDITIVVAYFVDKSLLQNTINKKIRILNVGDSNKRAYFKVVFWILYNWNFIKQHQIIHTHLTFGSFFGSVCYIFRKFSFLKNSFKVVETNHAVGMPLKKSVFLAFKIFSLFKDGIVLMANDGFWNNFLSKYPRILSEMIPNGIRIDTESYLKQNWAINRKFYGLPNVNNDVIIGSVSVLRPDRAPTLYIELLESLRSQKSDFNFYFLLAGDGVLYNEIKELAAKKNLSKYFIMSGLALCAIEPIIAMDFYVSLSAGGIAGVSMIEAALCKRPVLGYQLLKNYESNEVDWVWTSSDINEIAKKIIFFKNNNPSLNGYIAKQSDYVENNLTIEINQQRYMAFYKKLISKN